MAYLGTLGDTAKGEVVRRRTVSISEVMRDRDDLVLRDVIDRLIPRKLIARKYGIGRRTLYDIIERAPRRVRERILMQPRPYHAPTPIRPPDHLEAADLLLAEADLVLAEDGPEDEDDPGPPAPPSDWATPGRVYDLDPDGSHFFMGSRTGWEPDREGFFRDFTQFQDHDTCTVCGGPGRYEYGPWRDGPGWKFVTGAISRGSGDTCAGCMASDPLIEARILGEVVRTLVVRAAG